MPRILPIVHEPDPVLRKKAAPVKLSEWDPKELRQLAEDMILTMKKAPGVGLAAPQIGKSIRLIIVERIPTPLALINPEIVGHSLRKHTIEEGCLSVPGKYGLIKRYRSVKVKALTLDGKQITLEAKGFLAQILQHEMDHLNGTLYIDKAIKLRT